VVHSDDCLDYLDWLRWPEGLVCPRCETGLTHLGPELGWTEELAGLLLVIWTVI